jgi:hypothetical protein
MAINTSWPSSSDALYEVNIRSEATNGEKGTVDEFKRFEKLAKRLLRVPKTELGAQREKTG